MSIFSTFVRRTAEGLQLHADRRRRERSGERGAAARSRLNPGLESVEDRTLLTAQLIGTTLQITGTPGDDTVQIQLNAANPQILEVFDNSATPVTFNLGQILTANVNLLDGNDQLVVNFANGDPLSPGGLNYNGGLGINSLSVQGTALLSGSYVFGPINGADMIQAGTSTITLNNTASSTVSSFSTFNVTTPRSQDLLTLAGSASGATVLNGTSGGSPIREIGFLGIGEVVLDTGVADVAGQADDTVIVNSASAFPTFGQDITISTGIGNDLVNLEGTTGAYVLFGGDGNDSLIGGEGDDSIDGGAGDDVIAGSGGADLIVAGDGNDLVFGDEGDDTIFGGTGNDELAGGDGDDLLVGGAGDDSIAGQNGDDVIFGDAGSDSILGGLGNDTIFGNAGDDVLLGGEGDSPDPSNPSDAPDGDDEIFGGVGSDDIDGGNGDNILDGGDDLVADAIVAGSGNDIAFNHLGFKPALDDVDLDGGRNIVRIAGGLVEVDSPPEPVIIRGAVSEYPFLVPFLFLPGSNNVGSGAGSAQSVVPFNGPRVGAPPLPYASLRHRANNQNAAKAKKVANKAVNRSAAKTKAAAKAKAIAKAAKKRA